MLSQKIQQDYVVALKASEQDRVDVLRFLNAALKNKQIEKKHELSDEEIVEVIRKQIKQLNEAAVMFKKGGRNDLVSENEAQIKILQQYLPAEISDDELKKSIEQIVEENKAVYEKNPKAIIGICMSQLKSKAAPGRIMQILQSLSV